MSTPSPDEATSGDSPVDEPDSSIDRRRDVHTIEVDGRRILLVGTAHISRSSVELVREVIEAERPDRVCIELDERRFEALSDREAWQKLDLKQVIRKKALTTLLMNLLLASYQKKLGAELGVVPGTELLEAARVAQENDIPISLCDRDVRVTLRRAVHATPFLRRMVLLSEVLLSLLDAPEISEEQLQELREQDVLTELMNEMGKRHPSLKRVLIDERDSYLAQKIHDSDGQTVVAVVGAGHVQGIRAALENHRVADLDALDVIPPVSPWWKIAGWGVPVLILGTIALIGYQQGLAAAGDNLLFWTLANGIPASLGALIALAHPLTILAAFAAAPIASLTPVIGTAYVTAFVQAWVAPPTVKEFETVADDISSPRAWWRNRLLKIFLAYILPGLGSMIGSVVGGAELLSNLFQ
ncbi:MAG: TraB/GumN family protein [Acidobacteriota bacterium]